MQQLFEDFHSPSVYLTNQLLGSLWQQASLGRHGSSYLCTVKLVATRLKRGLSSLSYKTQATLFFYIYNRTRQDHETHSIGQFAFHSQITEERARRSRRWPICRLSSRLGHKLEPRKTHTNFVSFNKQITAGEWRSNSKRWQGNVIKSTGFHISKLNKSGWYKIRNFNSF